MKINLNVVSEIISNKMQQYIGDGGLFDIDEKYKVAGLSEAVKFTVEHLPIAYIDDSVNMYMGFYGLPSPYIILKHCGVSEEIALAELDDFTNAIYRTIKEVDFQLIFAVKQAAMGIYSCGSIITLNNETKKTGEE